MEVLPLVLGIISATFLAIAFFIYTNSKKATAEDTGANPTDAFNEEFSIELTPPPGTYESHDDGKTSQPDIPNTYGIDRLVLMARDPEWLFAYWEISATKQDLFKSKHGEESWEKTNPVLRVYDITGVDFDGSNANSYTDIAVNDDADNWHIRVGTPNRTFCVDLGRMFPNGHFVTLLRSNIVWTPRATLSDRIDEEWMWIEGIYRTISRQLGISSPLIIEEMEKRMQALPVKDFSPGFHMKDKEKHGGIIND